VLKTSAKFVDANDVI